MGVAKHPGSKHTMKTALLMMGLLAGGAAADSFRIEEGGQSNLLLVEPTTECHAVLRPGSRLLFAFPAENSGAMVTLGPTSQLTARSLQSITDPRGQTVRLQATCGGKLTLTQAVLGSVRTLRELTEGSGSLDKIYATQGAGYGRPLATRTRHGVVFTKAYVPGGEYRMTLEWPDQVGVQEAGSGYALESGKPFPLTVTVHVPHAALGGPSLAGLITPQAASLKDERSRQALRNLHFLARGGKLMAGSWRFLTYFGRDTLLSLVLLQPVLRPEVQRAALDSVVSRLRADGDVAHEEDLGDWAVLRHLQAGEKLPPRQMARPVYDYKMVDDDFLLPVVTDRVLGSAARSWLTPRRGRVVSNWKRVLKLASSGQVRILPREVVGDWRDSANGMGHGVYSGSVNHTLVPAALAAVVRLAPQLPGAQSLAPQAAALAKRWQGERSRYWVSLSAAQLRERLRAYLDGLDPAERDFFLHRPLGAGQLGQFLDGAELLPGGLRFLALSLDEKQKPVEVLNSDFSFLLFLGQPTRHEVEDCLRALELEYPLGLMTPFGPVVANPATSADPRHRQELTRNAYHGAVMWSWQSAMMEAGLLRQHARFARDPVLGPRLLRCVQKLVAADRAAGRLGNAELWTHRVREGRWEAVAFGADGADQTESNALQLWSTVFPANLMRLRRAGL